MHLLQELQQQLTVISHKESQDIKATLHNGITRVVREVQSVCKASNQFQQEDSLQVAAQYLPTSCSKLGSSPPGYYHTINPTNGHHAVEFCGLGVSADNPVSSCHSIATSDPPFPSSYYWINSSTGSAVQVYCDNTGHCCNSTGAWMRVANLDTTDHTQQCPGGFSLKTDPKRVCVRTTDRGCTSITFPVHGVQYSKVCGQVRGYQVGSTDALGLRSSSVTIDNNYVDGVSITHGALPRQHIWTFAAALDETTYNTLACPCTQTDTTYTERVPSFIGNDYFCETGTKKIIEEGKFYKKDPLWDGKRCGPTSSCCQFNSPPWFCKELPQPTTDDIQVRVCTNQSTEDVAIELIELYLQ